MAMAEMPVYQYVFNMISYDYCVCGGISDKTKANSRSKY